jgi:hypothetical protein
LSGWERAGPELDHPLTAEHALGGSAGYVGLSTGGELEQPRCFASMQVLAEQPFAPQPFLASAPKVAISDTQATITAWAGTQAWVELAREPSERTVELDGVRASGPIRLLWVGEQRVVAVGVRELLADGRPLLATNDEVRSSVVCELDAARCELDGSPLSEQQSSPDARR